MVDSYAWVEFFLGSSKGKRVKEIVETAADVYTPDIVLAELSRKYLREGVSESLVRERLGTVQAASQTVPITLDLAISASKAYTELSESSKRRKRRSPSLFDGLVLGTARLKEAKVLTGDPHFQDLPETLWL